MKEVEEVMRIVHDAVDPDAAIIFGVIIDPDLGDSLRVTVIATGLES